MAKRRWFEGLVSLTRKGPFGREVEGVVLSGGGVRASFQIGALRYLYERQHISPAKIVGTSGGSVIAAMIAQSLDPEEQAEQLKVLERYWIGMQDSSEIFSEQSWFTNLKTQWDEIVGVLPENSEESTVIDANADSAVEVIKQAFAFDPTPPEEPALAVLWQVLTSAPTYGRVAASLLTAMKGANLASSAYRPGPLLCQLLFESGFSSQAVRDSGVELRIAFVGLNSGKLRFMRQDGQIVNVRDEPIGRNTFDVALGLWASCAIPGVFRPVKMGDDVYVDGGVRENVPVEMLVSNLGVTKPYVIVAAPRGVPKDDFTNKNMVSVVMRSIDIIMDETNRDEVEWARAAGATVIEPRITVHSMMDVEPGLLAINRDYGWMRAAEETSGMASTGVVEEIVKVRMQLYALIKGRVKQAQAGANGKTVHGVKAVQAMKAGRETVPISTSKKLSHAKKIVKARNRLRELLATTDDALLPPDAHQWPEETWERGAPVAQAPTSD